MPDFIFMSSADLFGTGRSEKLKMKIYVSSGTRKYATPRQVNQRHRSLGHDALMLLSGLMSYRIIGYKLIKPLRDKTCQIDNGYISKPLNHPFNHASPGLYFSVMDILVLTKQ